MRVCGGGGGGAAALADRDAPEIPPLHLQRLPKVPQLQRQQQPHPNCSFQLLDLNQSLIQRQQQQLLSASILQPQHLRDLLDRSTENDGHNQVTLAATLKRISLQLQRQHHYIFKRQKLGCFPCQYDQSGCLYLYRTVHCLQVTKSYAQLCTLCHRQLFR